ncbi:MAG: hypothetical protein JRN62_03975 [Nitrososphaerota archaeon]|jgi:hypothetical protein|nr:hypothetical protein [Nitrososphaerota archaeon]MDG6948761.1 hypothetical protein [Nitrososphaerota archaeon]
MDEVRIVGKASRKARQGDLFFRKVSSLPTGAQEINDNVLARGEVTGHSHRILGAKVFRAGSQLLVQVEKEAQVVHEEHAAFVLVSGIYVVTRQHEYFPDTTRLVSD